MVALLRKCFGLRSQSFFAARHSIFRFGLAVPLILHLAVCAPPGTKPPSPVAGQVLVMSDLHFNPMADPKLVDRLAFAEPEDWAAVLETSGEVSLGRYGRNSSWRLLRSAFGQMRDNLQILPS